MQEFLNQLGDIGTLLWTLLGALLILIVGYIVARIIASVVRGLLKRVNIDNRLVEVLGGQSPGFSIEDVVGKVTFWVIMLFVIVGFLEYLRFAAVAAPLQALLDSIMTTWLPRLLAAVLLLLIAWAIATILKLLVQKVGQLLKLDERLSHYTALEAGEQVGVVEPLATFIFWFVFLLFLPDVLQSLGLDSISAPLQEMFTAVIAYIPNVFGAIIIGLVGYFVARIVRQIVVNLLAAIGTDRLGERAGLTGSNSLSRIIGLVVYTFILLLTLITALQTLDISAISDPAVNMLTIILNAIPAVLGAAIVLVIAYYVGRLVGNLIADLLRGIGFDNVPQKLGIQWSPTRGLSAWVGYIILVAIMLFAVLSAVELLGSTFLTDVVAEFITFGWQVLLAIVIIAIGLYLANLLRNVINSTGIRNASLLGNIAWFAVLVLAGAMGLRQMGVANDIVNLAFGILLGAIGIAAALAFGLGSREVAGREVERLVEQLRSEE